MNFPVELQIQLLHQVCWRAWRGVGSAIFMELGERFPYKKDSTPKVGSFSLCITACPWQVFRNNKLIFNSKTELKTIDSLLHIFEDQSLESVLMSTEKQEISLNFTSDTALKLYHNSPTDEWSILTPTSETVIRLDSIITTPRTGPSL